MKIGIISDLHLGHRQYGSFEREEDFYSQYLTCMKELSDQNVDIVIIAGDLFDKPNPSPKAMAVYRSGLNLFDDTSIVAIKGNHTMLMRENHYTVDNYFDDAGIPLYELVDDWKLRFNFGDSVGIVGITYRPDSMLDEFIEKTNNVLHKLYEGSKDDCFNILIVHQAFKEYCGFTGAELSINDLDLSQCDLVICGHIHSHTLQKVSDHTAFLQPGSIERMNTTEARDAQEQGKGYWILDTQTKDLDFHSVEFNRRFILGDIEFKTTEEMEKHFEELERTVKKMEVPPIISQNYYDFSGNIVHLRNLMKQVSKYSLINNSNVYDMSQEEVVLEISEDEIPTVTEAIKMHQELEEDSLKLAVDIHEAFRSGLDDSVEGILETFYKKKYEREEYSPDPLLENMEKEIAEYEKFFEQLGV